MRHFFGRSPFLTLRVLRRRLSRACVTRRREREKLRPRRARSSQNLRHWSLALTNHRTARRADGRTWPRWRRRGLSPSRAGIGSDEEGWLVGRRADRSSHPPPPPPFSILRAIAAGHLGVIATRRRPCVGGGERFGSGSLSSCVTFHPLKHCRLLFYL
jgi:hypothetical protein